jgi:CheY-like chemotaxis protein
MWDARTIVLYVEDEEPDRLFMQIAFQKAGIPAALRTAVNGQDAIDYLSGIGPYVDRSQHPLPSLVLLDLNMPLLPGFKVLEWVRVHPTFRALPVIIFTSSTKDEDKAQAKALRATDYIIKPFAMTKWAEIALHLKETWNLDDADANTATSPRHAPPLAAATKPPSCP